jgi:tetratricopeptide (TPR) repeat protein
VEHANLLIVRADHAKHLPQEAINSMYAKAQAQYEQALTQDPKDLIACQHYQELLGKTGQTKKHLSLLKKMTKIDAQNVDTLAVYGKFLLDQKDFGGAITKFEHGLRLDPNDAGILFDYATACIKLGDSDKAKINYRRVLEINPEDTPSLNDLGHELQVGQYSTASEAAEGLLEAEQLYRRAILATPGEWSLLYTFSLTCACPPGINTIVANFDGAKVNAMANLAALLMMRECGGEFPTTLDCSPNMFYDCESGDNEDLFYDCESGGNEDRQASLLLPLQEAEQLLKQALIMDPTHINSLGNMVSMSPEACNPTPFNVMCCRQIS